MFFVGRDVHGCIQLEPLRLPVGHVDGPLDARILGLLDFGHDVAVLVVAVHAESGSLTFDRPTVIAGSPECGPRRVHHFRPDVIVGGAVSNPRHTDARVDSNGRDTLDLLLGERLWLNLGLMIGERTRRVLDRRFPRWAPAPW